MIVCLLLIKMRIDREFVNKTNKTRGIWPFVPAKKKPVIFPVEIHRLGKPMFAQ